MLKELTQEEKIRLVLNEFHHLAEIPRPSTAEQAVGDYLEGVLREAGLVVFREACGNVIAEKKASVGYEARPTVILQAHMDMVCVSADEVVYDKMRDAIRLVEEGGYLCAEGTSLGADDGIGVAVIMAILKDTSLKHGKLRAIFTVEEETSMRGAREIDEKYLEGDYLINCDSEEVDTITVSSAGGMNIDVKLTGKRVARRARSATYCVELTGLRGGHSGVDIHRDRANAILVMANILNQQDNVRLIRIEGGMARNAIPNRAQAVIELMERDCARIIKRIADCEEALRQEYPAEDGLSLRLIPMATKELPLEDASLGRLLNFLQELPNGVRAMHKAIPSLVESSSNIGVIMTVGDEITLYMHPRSSEKSTLSWYRQRIGELASENQMELDCYGELPTWSLKQENSLADLASRVYEAQNKVPMKTEACHAGLECSYFYQKNPHLTMISIGPTVENVHSPEERIKIDTIAVHLDLIVGILEKLA